jgi:hypothetical protein
MPLPFAAHIGGCFARTGFAIAPATAKVVRYSDAAATWASRRCGTSRVWERQGLAIAFP